MACRSKSNSYSRPEDDLQEAEQLAAAWVEICFDGKAALMLQHTITKPYGWVFFYQSRSFLETQDERQMLLGNAPIIVDRVNGEVVVTGTAKPIEKYLEEYEAKIPPARLKMTPQPPATSTHCNGPSGGTAGH